MKNAIAFKIFYTYFQTADGKIGGFSILLIINALQKQNRVILHLEKISNFEIL